MTDNDKLFEMLDVINRKDKFIMYLLDQLINEYCHYNSNTPTYKLKQANTTLNNIQRWYSNSVELPFNERLLEVYDDAEERIESRIDSTKHNVNVILENKY